MRHIVILGAGASLAAFPNGDKKGRSLPLMESLVATLNLTDTLKGYRLDGLDNFEALYDSIYRDPAKAKLKAIVEDKIQRYFYEMKISSAPSLYDYIILSLREKDVIATFNWDPLLLQCLRRHKKYRENLPEILFLHWNVAVGICSSCDILGYRYNRICHRCLNPFNPIPLLYPIGKKDYSSDKYIRGSWEELSAVLKNAYYVTIFGSSAPVSDLDAKDLMVKSFHTNEAHAFSQVEIIDVKPREDVISNWNDFFYKNHYTVINNFSDSQLWHHPRRSCESHASAHLMNSPWKTNKFPLFDSISEMHKWIYPFVKEESSQKKNGIKLTACR